jgi:hypothetical protein
MSQEPPQTFISPHFPSEKLDSPSVEDLIDVFEDRLSSWLLGPAKKLLEHPVDRVAGFALSLSYFEGISIYLRGEDSKGKSKHFFRDGFVDVFRPSRLEPALLERVADVLYEDGRCGFFHDAMFRTRVYFSEYYGEPLVIALPKVNGVIDEAGEIQTLVVHCPKYFEYLEGHFTKYVARLRDKSESDLRGTFQAACDLKWGLSSPPRVIVL